MTKLGLRIALCLLAFLMIVQTAWADSPTVISFPERSAKWVRVVLSATNSGGQVCLDELEVYGKTPDKNLALIRDGAKATASSCIAGYAIHTVDHLNDGEYGNAKSWVAAGNGIEWAQIELPSRTSIGKVVFSRDRTGGFSDRIATSYEVFVSKDGKTWDSVKKVRDKAAVSGLEAIPPTPPPLDPLRATADNDTLRYAFLAEEHAWLKTYGRADISPALVPYNGRVKEYPRHVGDDRVPLPRLVSSPKCDVTVNDPCWSEASQGTVRVAYPYDFDAGPLVTSRVRAGWRGKDLFLAIEQDRWLSAHLAVVSSEDGQGAGVIVASDKGLTFTQFAGKGQIDKSIPIEGAWDRAQGRLEARLPLDLFPECRTVGLRIGLGMGGKHTGSTGRPVHFAFSTWSVAQEGSGTDKEFRVRLDASSKTRLSLNAPGMEGGIVLKPGTPVTVTLPAESSPIGPRYDLTLDDGSDKPYALSLFRYDPAKHALALLESMIERSEANGIDAAQARAELAAMRERHAELMAADTPDLMAEREAFLRVREAKRALLLRDPALAPMAKLLFVKRQPFQPSHNYSDYFDAPFRPGGGVFTIDVPHDGGRFAPEAATLTQLFDAKDGIARNPAASYDARTVYFGYRPSEPGYYHVMAMDASGGSLRQLTDGPFHDFWPCPLPDGDLAFISTRCISRVFCWRPQSSVLFRMDTDGGHIVPVSLSNLTEWAPSVMNDGRILWTRWEYQDKGADFGHTLWSIRPDGTFPEMIFGNDIIQPNGYANGREVPDTREICCTLISHFGDLNGPIALLDVDQGRFNPKAITCLTPEVPWPGAPPMEECFREAYPIARDYFLCSHAPRDRFCLYLIDRFGNRELIYSDPTISSMCPTPMEARPVPPVIGGPANNGESQGEFMLADVYNGLEPEVPRGTVKYLRVVEEVRHDLDRLADGEYRKDHEAFMQFYASPDDIVTGPFGWPTYVVKASLGLVPVEEDGSAHFYAPADKVLYFEALDKDFNEVQRMRSVIQLQPGEKRSCVGCHESRQAAPSSPRRPLAMMARAIDPPSWGAEPFSFEKVVQPVLDAKCVQCHDASHPGQLDFSGTLDVNRVPASYRTLITKGLVHYLDCGWNSGGCEKAAPLTFGSVKSKLWQTLNAGHHEVALTPDETLRIKTWIDLNCPLWPDYTERSKRPGGPDKVAMSK